MICVIRPSDCSTSVGIVLADEATGICAKLLTGETAIVVNKATPAIKRGKLADIKLVVLLQGICEPSSDSKPQPAHSFNCAVSNDSSMIWIQQDSLKGAKITLEVTTRFFGVSITHPL